MKIGFMGRTRMLADTINLVKKNKEHKVSFIWTSKAESYYECDAEVFESIAKDIGCPFIYGSSIADGSETPPADVVISINFINNRACL